MAVNFSFLLLPITVIGVALKNALSFLIFALNSSPINSLVQFYTNTDTLYESSRRRLRTKNLRYF